MQSVCPFSGPCGLFRSSSSFGGTNYTLSLTVPKSVFCYYNKIPETGWLIRNRGLFSSQFGSWEVQEHGTNFCWGPSCCILTWQRAPGGQSNRVKESLLLLQSHALNSPLIHEWINSIGEAEPSGPNHFPKIHLQVALARTKEIVSNAWMLGNRHWTLANSSSLLYSQYRCIPK
jgi:hypothetical protein